MMNRIKVLFHWCLCLYRTLVAQDFSPVLQDFSPVLQLHGLCEQGVADNARGDRAGASRER